MGRNIMRGMGMPVRGVGRFLQEISSEQLPEE